MSFCDLSIYPIAIGPSSFVKFADSIYLFLENLFALSFHFQELRVPVSPYAQTFYLKISYLCHIVFAKETSDLQLSLHCLWICEVKQGPRTFH